MSAQEAEHLADELGQVVQASAVGGETVRKGQRVAAFIRDSQLWVCVDLGTLESRTVGREGAIKWLNKTVEPLG